MKHSRLLSFVCLFTLASNILLVSCEKPVHSKDKASRANRTPESFPAADKDYFHDMDGAISLTADEIKGRNMWLVWTDGDDKLWDTLTTTSLGTLDFLKTISSRPGFKAQRSNRWLSLFRTLRPEGY